MFVPLPPIYDSEDELRDLTEKLEQSLTRTVLTTDLESPDQEIESEEPKTRKRRYHDGLLIKVMYTVETSGGPIEVESWKMKEFHYGRKEVVFPIRARGLFMRNGKILARGYDKFFNVDEVEDTKLDTLKEWEGPFSASTKENGCIILISGLEDGTLLVCSKHSTGRIPREKIAKHKNAQTDFVPKHCVEGEKAVREVLARKGKSAKDLALTLYLMNATAMLELCDDNFEEHILRYPKEVAGLYLHGINMNTRKFHTYPIDKVAEFADEWGFRKVEYTIFEEFADLWNFLENMKVHGCFQGRELEGFVVRSVQDNEDRFFKYKFEEPYFLYRLLREVTVKLIDKHRPESIEQIMNNVTKHKIIANDYLHFAKEEFARNPELVDLYRESIGIIGMREKYMASKGIENGMDLLELNKDAILSEQLAQLIRETKQRVVIIPIAVPGSGKTTTFKTLTDLFPNWAMAQNDDYKDNLEFFEQVYRNIDQHEVSIVDMNFHQGTTRLDFFKQIAERRSTYISSDIAINFVGLNYFSQGRDNHASFLRKNVRARGDNHQSLRIDSKNTETQVLAVMERFLGDLKTAKLKGGTGGKSSKDTEVGKADGTKLACWPESENLTGPPFAIEGRHFLEPDNKFQHVLQLKLSHTETFSLETAKTVVAFLKAQYPFAIPREISDAEWDRSWHLALDYKPQVRKEMKKDAVKKRPLYYAVGIKNPKAIRKLVGEIIGEDPAWVELIDLNSLQNEFHVTLGHSFSFKKHQEGDDDGIPFPDVSVNKLPRTTPLHTQAQKPQIQEEDLGNDNLDIAPSSEVPQNGKNKNRGKQKKTKPTKEQTEKEIVKLRWQNLSNVFDLKDLKKNAKSGKRVSASQGFDVQLDQIVVVENTLIALKVKVSDAFDKVNDVWVQQNMELTPLNKYLHITVGTYPGISPSDSNYYLERLYSQEPNAKPGTYTVRDKVVRVYDVHHFLEKQKGYVQFPNFEEEKKKATDENQEKIPDADHK